MSLPANQRKLDATEQLAELADKAGMTLVELAIAFVLRHPAVTALFRYLTAEESADYLAIMDLIDMLDQERARIRPGLLRLRALVLLERTAVSIKPGA